MLAALAALAAPAALPGCFSTFPDPCGNGIVQSGEECDDGNRFDFDGCSSTCRVEPQGAQCGDGVVEVGEDCDPPNFGFCTFDCQFPAGECGNGTIEPPEECDPPDGVNCTGSCRIGGPPQPPGSPCGFDPDCGTPDNPALTAWCLNSPEFPNGFCVLLGCTDFGSGSDCPTGSDCITVPQIGGGTLNVCAPSCTPEGNGTGGCRTDETADGAYACYLRLTGAGGSCWAGCATAAQCNDTTLPPDQWTSLCSDTNNRCYVGGTPGAAVGDPCLADEDCTEGGSCLAGDWIGDMTDDWPGGYCSKIGCRAYAGNPVWDCPAGSTCAATGTPWLSTLPIDLCLADCTGDGNAGTCRAADDYECMDFADLSGLMTDGVAGAGAGGWCFDCAFEHVIAGTDPAACP